MGEGNTRTTAVFFIKYLRTLGFDATNDIFAENAWYFRNALVRANYNNLKEGVHETTEYLELLLRNLLLDEKNELHNRSIHIIALFEECGRDTIFGRSIVEKITGLKFSRASAIINLMLVHEIIEPVKGYGKGKYRFR